MLLKIQQGFLLDLIWVQLSICPVTVEMLVDTRWRCGTRLQLQGRVWLTPAGRISTGSPAVGHNDTQGGGRSAPFSNEPVVEKMKTAISEKQRCLRDCGCRRNGRKAGPETKTAEDFVITGAQRKWKSLSSCLRCACAEGGFSTFIMQRELGCEEEERQK